MRHSCNFRHQVEFYSKQDNSRGMLLELNDQSSYFQSINDNIAFICLKFCAFLLLHQRAVDVAIVPAAGVWISVPAS